MLRNVNINDKNITFYWANDPLIRKYSINKSKISFADHLNWLHNKINDIDSEYYILELNGKPIGSIRFDELLSKNSKINYLIDSAYFGKGYGKYILDEGIKKLKDKFPEIISVYGVVYKQNIASLKIFEKLNFERHENSDSKIIYKKNI